jgi:hypothetical protein
MEIAAIVSSFPGLKILSKEPCERIQQAMRDLLPDPDPDSLNTEMYSSLTKKVNICKYSFIICSQLVNGLAKMETYA